jgi:hypothetical protein
VAQAAPSAPIGANGPDAELIALCATFDDLSRQFDGLHVGPNRIEDDEIRDVALDPIERQQKPLIDAICIRRAVTPDGISAKARSLIVWAPDWLQPNPFWDERLIASILADLTGSAAV